MLPALRMCTPRPLVAINTRGTRSSGKADTRAYHVLTADVRRAAERGGDVRVQVDHEVPLLGKLVVAVLHLLRDPLPEVVAAQGIDDVDDPLPRQLGHVSLVGQVQSELLRLSAVLKDGLDGERLVHGHVEMLCALGLEDYRWGW